NDGIPADSRMALPGYGWLKDNLSDAKLTAVRALAPIAGDLGVTQAQLAIAWCAANPRVSTVITGASRPEQVRENMKAMDVVPKLTPELMQKIGDIVKDIR
ncbi:MAG: aldo/keto reductase, partial [Spirochaetes bacterium]|nr:aldo/keto reductase [Spirochaetota bacterium]